MAGVFGGGPATKEDATAATDAASSSAGTPAPQPPAGVPAPDQTVIGSFDGGSATAPYGSGWFAGGDETRGGDSQASQQVVADGAGGSKGALEVTGTVGEKIQYASAGTVFFPEGQPRSPGFMSYSAKKSLRFQARGDGRSYTLLIQSGLVVDAIPFMYSFTAGPEWNEVKITFSDYPNVDWTRVKMIGVLSMGSAGPFRFQIDDVRVE
jgi:hypothetical protein